MLGSALAKSDNAERSIDRPKAAARAASASSETEAVTPAEMLPWSPIVGLEQ